MERLLKKFETAKSLVPAPVVMRAPKPTKHRRHPLRLDRPAMDEAVAAGRDGVHVDALRVRGFPFSHEVTEFIAAHERVFVVEQNRDAQLRTLLMIECGIDPAKLVPVLHYDGTPITARFIARRSRLKAAVVAEKPGPVLTEGLAMTYLAKPKFHHPKLETNALGFTHRDYEGAISTLCAGCGHDSISSAIMQACFELEPAAAPHRQAVGHRLLVEDADLFPRPEPRLQLVHGRMPSVLTGANLANRDLIYLGVSGDGDSASIGFGQFAHSIRRGVNMVYIVENNGVYGLTKGQFSATADKGSKSKKGVANPDSPIDLVAMALSSAPASSPAPSPATRTSWCR
jgi:TPP-dependent indolepyruvate ferredoxin oxidoreductase alpha subunit